MFRLFAFLTSLLLIAGGFAQAVVDGTASIGADKLMLTPLGKLLALLSATLPGKLQGLVSAVSPQLWDTLFVPLLAAPAFIALWVVGFSLYIASRKGKPQIGVSNRDR